MPEALQDLSRREIHDRAVALWRAGKLFDPADTPLHSVFRGSVDRFCTIAHRLRGCRRVLDVGAGHGMLLALLHELGHECCAVDFADQSARYPAVYRTRSIPFHACNVEIDPLPFADDAFDAVTCCQVLEHFTHSHLHAAREMCRVLAPGGIMEADVPNVVSFRNRSRVLRGKNITYDYREHYLYAEPVLDRGYSFYPVRHNREFTRAELQMLLEAAGFTDIEVSYLKSRQHREGFARLKSIGTAIKDAIPSLRKSLIAFARKP